MLSELCFHLIEHRLQRHMVKRLGAARTGWHQSVPLCIIRTLDCTCRATGVVSS